MIQWLFKFNYWSINSVSCLSKTYALFPQKFCQIEKSFLILLYKRITKSKNNIFCSYSRGPALYVWERTVPSNCVINTYLLTPIKRDLFNRLEVDFNQH